VTRDVDARLNSLRMYFRVSTVQCPKVIYVIHKAVTKVSQQDSQRLSPYKNYVSRAM